MSRKPADEADGVIEDHDYMNAAGRPEDKAPPDQKLLFSSPSLPPVAVCWLILLLIMGLRIYFLFVISEQNVMLKKEIQQLMKENQQLIKENQEQKENFTKQITDLEKNWKEFNVSRAQWTIDSYCPKDQDPSKGRTCSACQKGWDKIQMSCYVLHDSQAPSDLKTWEEARENCRGRDADLFVAHNNKEKGIIDRYIAGFPIWNGYWIGLKVEGGTWKWIDGTELTDASWIGPPAEGHCAVSLSTRWASVRCDQKRTRICTQKALSL
ncbi:clec12b [Pungitius sinensis]